MAESLNLNNMSEIIEVFKFHNIDLPSDFYLWKIRNINKILFKAKDILKMHGYTDEFINDHISKFYNDKDFMPHEKIKSSIKGKPGGKTLFITEQAVYSTINKIRFTNKDNEIAFKLYVVFNELIELVRRTHPNLYIGALTNNVSLLTNKERNEYIEMKQENEQLTEALIYLDKENNTQKQEIARLTRKLNITEEHNDEMAQDYQVFQGNIKMIKTFYDPISDTWGDDKDDETLLMYLELGNNEYIENFKEYKPLLDKNIPKDKRRSRSIKYVNILFDLIEYIIDTVNNTDIEDKETAIIEYINSVKI